MDDSKFQTALLKRFNTLISLVLDVASPDRSVSITEKIQRLSDIGLTAAEIADILDKKTNYITAVIHRKKKRVEK